MQELLVIIIQIIQESDKIEPIIFGTISGIASGILIAMILGLSARIKKHYLRKEQEKSIKSSIVDERKKIFAEKEYGDYKEDINYIIPYERFIRKMDALVLYRCVDISYKKLYPIIDLVDDAKKRSLIEKNLPDSRNESYFSDYKTLFKLFEEITWLKMEKYS